MARVIAYIDGFNMYHALEGDTTGGQRGKYRKYKWLDYPALAKCFIGGQDTLEKVYLFTALATWDQDKVNRHSLYLRVLRRRGVEVVMGRFKRRTRRCTECHKVYRTFEEKLTDVNIAIYLFRGAMLDEYDKAIIISGDTDSLPALRMVRELFPNKEVGVVLPIERKSEDLKQECDFYIHMNEHHLARSQLPDEIDDPGRGKIRRPATWV
ncbi:MAG: NYN domain-containing protein [candidate division WOR-3 bacterium]|nr:NYN domain-containing protein [candidate division WOR-3 bacterium]